MPSLESDVAHALEQTHSAIVDSTNELFAAVSKIEDDLERYELATRISEALKELADRYALIRESAVLHMVDQKVSLQKIADRLNLTKSRVQALSSRADNRRADRRRGAVVVPVERRSTPDRRSAPLLMKATDYRRTISVRKATSGNG